MEHGKPNLRQALNVICNAPAGQIFLSLFYQLKKNNGFHFHRSAASASSICIWNRSLLSSRMLLTTFPAPISVHWLKHAAQNLLSCGYDRNDHFFFVIQKKIQSWCFSIYGLTFRGKDASVSLRRLSANSFSL